MNSKYWLYLFFADLLLELAAIASGWNDLRLFTKPLLVILLLVWFVASSIKLKSLHYYIAAALIFSWLGDVFLMLEEKNAVWFMAGLGSFLIAHIMYILFFLKSRKQQTIKQSFNFLIIIAVAVYVIALFTLLYAGIGSLKIPVGIYAVTIAVMFATAAHAFGIKFKNAALYCTAGAALFVISDSLLALNKFYRPFPAAGLCIMLTYALAQFAIVKGSLLYLAKENVNHGDTVTQSSTGN